MHTWEEDGNSLVAPEIHVYFLHQETHFSHKVDETKVPTTKLGS